MRIAVAFFFMINFVLGDFTYEIIDPPFGGNNIVMRDINDNGRIVCYEATTFGLGSFVYDSNTDIFYDASYLGFPDTWLYGINNDDIAVGSTGISGTIMTLNVSYDWPTDTFTLLGSAFVIFDSAEGTVVGTYTLPSGLKQGQIFDGVTTDTYIVDGSEETAIYGMSETTSIICGAYKNPGEPYWRGYTYNINDDVFTEIYDSSAPHVYVMGVNDDGHACGYKSTGGSPPEFTPFYWNGVSMVELDNPSNLSIAFGINNDNVICGVHYGSAPIVGFIATPSNTFLRGDSNGDGIFNISDPASALAYIFSVPGSSTPECLDAGDVNDDGALNITDGIYMLYGLFVPGSPPPVAPFPDCGNDPTVDTLDCAHPFCL